MIALITAAFLVGIIGSFHCIGMCGPLALSLPLQDESTFGKVTGALLYNAGRVVTYMALGLALGLIGQSIALFGFQQWLSIGLGALILIGVLPALGIIKRPLGIPFLPAFFTSVRNTLGKLFSQRNPSALFLIGLLNGLLPCGLVYMAIAGAIATGTVLHAVVFMAFFGLGTLPVMWSVIFLGNYINLSWRQRIRRAYPYLMMVMACLLILRGMGLGIPYISPALSNEKKPVPVYCCPHP